MNLPTSDPVTLSDVREWLQLADSDTGDDDQLAGIAAAVSGFVRRLPTAERSQAPDGDPPPAAWAPETVLGATMLAARLWRRKDSPAGVAAFAEYGPVYVQRNDPDVALLLELGDYSRPSVG